MNRDEAKTILLLYRHGTADAEDPQIAEALALAQRDPELADWLEMHCARQLVIGDKFRQIAAPAGLKEQIISELARAPKAEIGKRGGGRFLFPAFTLSVLPNVRLALAVVILLAALLAFFHFEKNGADDTLAVFQNQMAGVALRGYAMDLTTNEPAPIRAWLAQRHAPADFILPAALQHAALTGCAVAGWQNTTVSMICFRTAKAVAAGGPSDLWLFVADRASVKGAPAAGRPQFSKANRLTTATWTQGEKIYLLGTEDDLSALKEYL